MKINANEISALIKEQIKNYDHQVDSADVGTVVSVGDGIAIIYGLEKAMLGELLAFPNDIYGMVMNLESDSVGAVLLGDDTLIKEGDSVKRTNMVMEVPVGDAMLGRVVNALGVPIDGEGSNSCPKFVQAKFCSNCMHFSNPDKHGIGNCSGFEKENWSYATCGAFSCEKYENGK